MMDLIFCAAAAATIAGFFLEVYREMKSTRKDSKVEKKDR